MNDLHFIFYKAKDMIVDTQDMDRDTELAHRRLCDFIWAMERPPKNDNEILRQITRTPESLWGKVKLGLTEKGWFSAGAYLVHRGVIQSLNDSAAKYAENYNRTALAGKRPHLTPATDPITGITTWTVATPVTKSVTEAVTQPVTAGQSERQSESQPHSEPSNPPRSMKEGDARGRNGQPARAGYLTLEGLNRVAGAVLESNWYWDNCKVTPDMFTRSSLVSVLRPYAGRVPEQHVLAVFHEAIKTAHARCVDAVGRGSVGKPGALAVTILRELLDKSVQ